MKLLERIIQLFSPEVDCGYTPVVGDLPSTIVAKMKSEGLSPCHNAKLVRGPEGSGMMNCWCEKCHARYNISFYLPVDYGECTMTRDDIGFAWYTGEHRI